MIPVDQPAALEAGLTSLESFAARTSIRGRFVALYLGLRRMGSTVAPLGDSGATPASEIEAFMDLLFTKTHRPEPFVVLTAPFGQSTSPSAPYSTRSGETAPGNKYPTNTWRNNFAIQKGIGCPAEPEVIRSLLTSSSVRLGCPHMAVDPEGRHVCGLESTSYRGEEHSIWLRMTPSGYQVVDLNLPPVYSGYLNPGGERIPVFPLIAMLYCLARKGVFPSRATVGIPEFAADFHFSLDQVSELFDCDPESAENAAFLAALQGGVITAAAEPGSTGGLLKEVAIPAAPLPILKPGREINTGVGAELAVAQDLSRYEWDVSYRGNQRSAGYDLEAHRNGETLRVEVKSSVGFTTPELSAVEWEAAQRFGDECVLAVVDFYGSEQQAIWYVRNPAASAVPVEVPTVLYRLPRADIHSLGTDAEFL